MANLKQKTGKKHASSPKIREYLQEYDPYADFLVTGHASNPQRLKQLGQLVRALDGKLDIAGRGENGTGGKSLLFLLYS